MSSLSNPVIQSRPFHLYHYEDDLCYFVEELSRESDCLTTNNSTQAPSEDGFFLVSDGIGQDGQNKDSQDKDSTIYLRVLYYRPDQTWYASLTYAPWPAFVDDPLLSMEGFSRWRDALEQTFRVYSYYRHETRKPAPFLHHYTDYRLTEEAIQRLEKKVTTKIIVTEVSVPCSDLP